MKRSKFSEEQVAYALRQVEAGTPVGDVCRQLGVSEATFYAWKKKYAHLGVSELRRLRQLEDENARLKRLVADLTLDKHMLSGPAKKRLRPARRWNEERRALKRSPRAHSRLLTASHAARYVACHGVRSHAVPVALVGECSIPFV